MASYEYPNKQGAGGPPSYNSTAVGGYPVAPQGYAPYPQAGVAPYPEQASPYPPQGGYPVAPQPGYPGPPTVYPMVPGQPQVPPFGFAPAPVVASGGGNVYQPGSNDPNVPKADEDALEGTLGSSFGEKAIRHAFVRKVYLILMAQLLITVSFIALFSFHQGLKMFVRRNIWVYFLSFAVFLVTYITLICCSGVRRKWPGNIIMLGIFTLAMSYMTGTISSMYDTDIVLMTVGITAAICFLISLFAMQTKYDFTGCGTYLFVAGMVMIIFGIVAIFTYSKIINTLYSAGIALLFSMYLVYDTQMLLGGRKHELSPEEHIYGAIVLYMDIIQIFMSLLSLFGNNNN